MAHKVYGSLRDFFSGKKQETKDSQLGRAGISVSRDQFLIPRLIKIEQTLEKDDFDINIDQKIATLDKLLDEVALIWGEGAEDDDFLWRYGAWKQLVARYLNMAAHYVKREGEETSRYEQRRQTLKLFAQNQIVPYVWVVIGKSMKAKHITPHEPIVIQSNLREGTGGYGFFDPSGGKRSGEGQQEGAPATLENKV